MIKKFKSYPAMKESGVQWLGKVPEHWEVRRLRNVAEMRVSNIDKHSRDDEETVRLCNYVDVYKNDRIRNAMNFMRATATRDEIDRFRLKTGDVLITKDSEAWNDIGVPALVTDSADDLVCGYHLALLRPFTERIISVYLFRALQSTSVAYQFHVEANGVTRYGLSHSAIRSICIPLPSLPEQDAIVRFLDYANRRIERYIRAKKKLIALLNEQKQAIIHCAVTRGLDPNVRFKSSGIPWLGEIPEHWDVMRLVRVIADGPKNGISPQIDERGTIESFSIAAVRDGIVEVRPEDKKYISGNREALQRAYGLLRGDILLVRGNGNIRLVGKAGVVEEDMPDRVYPDLLMRLRLAPTCLARYLVALLNCPIGRDQIETAARTAVGTFKINNQQVRRLCFALPSVREQQKILDWLAAVIGPITIATHQMENEISLIREYRTQLVADVVTGQLDVREAAANLPEEPREEDIEPGEDSTEDEAVVSEFEEVAGSGTIG